MKLKIGNMNRMVVERQSDLGYILKLEDEEVLLHHNDTAGVEVQIGSTVNAFLFYDHKGRVAATLQVPYITSVDCDFVKVVDVVGHGCYLDIGIRRDVLLSADDLPIDKSLWPQVGDEIYAYLKIDRDKALLIEMASKEDYIDIKVEAEPSLYGKKIQVRPIFVGAEGINVISTEGYLGFIHRTEYRDEPRLGQLVEARVIFVKDDGELNLSLIPQKEIALQDDAELIYAYLEEHEGVLHLTDKSTPEEINEKFNMSKAAFKRAVGHLLKDKKIEQDLDKREIRLKK